MVSPDSSYARPFSVHSGIAWVQYQFTHHYSLFKEPATHCPHPGVKPFKTISIVAWRVNSLPLPSTTMCLVFVSINKNIFGNLGVDSSVSVTCVPQIWQANPLIISRNKHADIHTWIYLIRFDSHIKHIKSHGAPIEHCLVLSSVLIKVSLEQQNLPRLVSGPAKNGTN